MACVLLEAQHHAARAGAPARSAGAGMGCSPSQLEYHAPSELAYPRDTRHLDVRGLSAKDPTWPSALPLIGMGSASMVGFDPLQRDKVNQDNFAADACLCDDPNLGLFAVMDGHGPHGRQVAALLADELQSHVAAAMTAPAADRGGGGPSGGSEAQPPPPPCAQYAISCESALRRAFLAQHVSLLKQCQESAASHTQPLPPQPPPPPPPPLRGDALDCRVSGSTCAVLLLEPTRAVTANVGDSRCVAAVQRSSRDRLRAVEWTTDQTPELPEEGRRLRTMGARIMPWDEDKLSRQPVQRIWLPDADSPGLAISRSFGDTVAAQVGVMAEPVVRTFALTRDVRFLILATDGLWQFMTSQEAVDLTARVLDAGYTVHDATWQLIAETSERWARDGAVCDDITICVLLLDQARLPHPSLRA